MQSNYKLHTSYQDFDHDNEAMQRFIPRLGDNFPSFFLKAKKRGRRRRRQQVRQTQYDAEMSLLVASRVAEEIK